MARSATKVVKLAEFVQETPWNGLLAFDADEWIEVVPFGGLQHELCEQLFKAWELPIQTPEGEPILENIKKRDAMNLERRNATIVNWSMKQPTGEPWPTPGEDPSVWFSKGMTLDLINFVDHIVYYAFEDRESKRQRVGEGSGSSPRSTVEEPTPSSSDSNSRQSGSRSRTKERSLTTSGAKP